MANITTIKGFDTVINNLNKEIMAIKNRSLKGLIMGAAIIRNDMEKTPPLTPVDLGNLRASWFVVTSKGSVQGGEERLKSKTFVGKNASKMQADHQSVIGESQAMTQKGPNIKYLIMGYSANYALWVHEMRGATFNPERKNNKGKPRQRAGAGPKWFEASFNRNQGRVLQVIKDNVTIKR